MTSTEVNDESEQGGLIASVRCPNCNSRSHEIAEGGDHDPRSDQYRGKQYWETVLGYRHKSADEKMTLHYQCTDEDYPDRSCGGEIVVTYDDEERIKTVPEGGIERYD